MIRIIEAMISAEELEGIYREIVRDLHFQVKYDIVILQLALLRGGQCG